MAAKLRPVPDLPGVWRPEDVPQPGTYAFIVGVSAYRYLDGSEKSLTLGQLAVSALTAYHVFRYFADAYRHRTAPIAEVTLLLAPSAQEQHLFDSQPDYPITCETAPLPTLATLSGTLQEWYARLAALDTEAAKSSRLVFFFSGHGLELAPSQQLLLPHDYPGPARMFNNAIGTENIHAGLGALPIREQLFFIDACRNDIASLHELAMTAGVPVLDVRRRQQGRAAPILWASAPGASTFQPDVAEDFQTTSFFGRALLDALLLRDQEFQPDCRSRPCKIDFFPLVDYTNASMAQQLSTPDGAPVIAGGIVRNVTVSHVAAPPRKVAFANAARPRADDAEVVEYADALRMATPPPALQPQRAALNASDLESVLGAARVFMWEDEWHDVGPDALRLASKRWTADSRSFEQTFRFRRGDRWHLLLLEQTGIGYASMFPAAFAEDPLFSLVLDRQVEGDTIASVRATLSDENSPQLQNAVAFWNPAGPLRYMEGAAASWSADRLVALFDRAPLAGTLIALGLLRRGEFECLDPLLERFTQPRLPMSDLPVLALRLMKVQHSWDARVLQHCLAAIGELGMPATHEAAQYLVSFLLNDLHTDGSAESSFGSDALGQVAQQAAAEAHAALDNFAQVGPVMRSGGLFVTLVTPTERMPAFIRLLG
jgi:hypothetical protein